MYNGKLGHVHLTIVTVEKIHQTTRCHNQHYYNTNIRHNENIKAQKITGTVLCTMENWGTFI